MTSVAKDIVKARRSVKAYTQTIPAAPDEIFLLLCPVQEKAWLDGWDYEMVYSQSGYAEDGCVFTTHDGSRETVWVVTHHDPENHEIRFSRITAGLAATTLVVRVDSVDDGPSKVHIQYTHTSLGDQGDAFLETITDEVFNQIMRFWEASMTHYLATGEKLSKDEFSAAQPGHAAQPAAARSQ